MASEPTAPAREPTLEEAAEAVLASCSLCFGKVEYESRCPRCDDSTEDHHCVTKTRRCKACAEFRAALSAHAAREAARVEAVRAAEKIVESYIEFVNCAAHEAAEGVERGATGTVVLESYRAALAQARVTRFSLRAAFPAATEPAP